MSDTTTAENGAGKSVPPYAPFDSWYAVIEGMKGSFSCDRWSAGFMGDERPVKLTDGQSTEVHDEAGQVVARITAYRSKGRLMARVKPPRGGKVIPQKREGRAGEKLRERPIKRLTRRQPDA